MTPFWIRTEGTNQLAIVLRPRGQGWLPQELLAIKAAGVDVIVSLLTRDEEGELGLSEEAELCTRVGLQFRSFPIADRSAPESLRSFLSFARELEQELAMGRTIATHCRASIGRAAITAGAILLLKGMSVDEALRVITEARGTSVPDTQEQVLWMERFAEYAHAQQ